VAEGAQPCSNNKVSIARCKTRRVFFGADTEAELVSHNAARADSQTRTQTGRDREPAGAVRQLRHARWLLSPQGLRSVAAAAAAAVVNWSISLLSSATTRPASIPSLLQLHKRNVHIGTFDTKRVPELQFLSATGFIGGDSGQDRD